MFGYWYILFVLGWFSYAQSQPVCTRRVATFRVVPETYTRTFRETYRGNCWFYCRKTRLSSYTDSRWVQKRVVNTEEYCCDGYIKRDEDFSDTIQCDPICIPNCKNGYCDKPGECKCNQGYTFKMGSTYFCEPSCSSDCGHGYCAAPEVCECDFGYNFKNGTCQPVCSNPCVNGTCTAPDSCECNIGYRKSEDNNCTPYCSKGCTNGYCVSPEICLCIDGYEKFEDICIPHCDTDCGNGKCVRPNECLCDPGHKIENGTCVPHCNIPCDHGKCIGPNTCDCDEGWTNDGGVCQPKCSFSCGVGTCVAPNECRCNSGYINSENGSCIPNCSECVHGTCVAPGICECDAGWIKDEKNICIPFCSIGCGNGSCVEPDKCKCDPGYKENIHKHNVSSHEMKIKDLKACVPDCGFCNGTCVEPNKCVCEYPYFAEINPECTDISCNVTYCIFVRSTSTEENIIFDEITMEYITTNDKNNTENDISYALEEVTEIFNASISFEDRFGNDEVSEINKSSTISEYVIAANHKSTPIESWFPYWIYIVLLAAFVIAALFALLIINRGKLRHYCNGGSYAVEGYEQSKDMNFTNSTSSLRSYCEIEKQS